MKNLFQYFKKFFTKDTATNAVHPQSTYIPLYSDANPFYTPEEKEQWIQDEVLLRREEALRYNSTES